MRAHARTDAHSGSDSRETLLWSHFLPSPASSLPVALGFLSGFNRDRTHRPRCAQPPRRAHATLGSLTHASFYFSVTHGKREYICLSSGCYSNAPQTSSFSNNRTVSPTVLEAEVRGQGVSVAEFRGEPSSGSQAAHVFVYFHAMEKTELKLSLSPQGPESHSGGPTPST